MAGRRQDVDGAVLVGTWYQDSFETRRDVLGILAVVLVAIVGGWLLLAGGTTGEVTATDLESRGITWPFSVEAVGVACAADRPSYHFADGMTRMTMPDPVRIDELPFVVEEEGLVRAWSVVRSAAADICNG